MWMPLGLVIALAALFLGGLRGQVEATGYQELATDRSRLVSGDAWADPRWEAELRRALAGLDPDTVESPILRSRVRAAVEELSFVRAVGEPGVVWPDGLRLAIELRRPVACVLVERSYYTVDAEGVVLPGSWPAPPALAPEGSGWLPVIGPVDGSYDRLRPGDRMETEGGRGALAVARSLLVELAPEERGQLGRVVIDGEGPPASAEDPGVVLELEGGRSVWFGRPPDAGEPGELPAHLKWRSLASALKLLADGSDWSLVDVRWDRPEIRLRGAEPR